MALPKPPPRALLPPLPPPPSMPNQPNNIQNLPPLPHYMGQIPYNSPYGTPPHHPQGFHHHPAFLGSRPRSQSMSTFNHSSHSPPNLSSLSSPPQTINYNSGKKVGFDDEIKRGYLYKESKYLKSWRRRLMMIKGPYLYSFKDSINEEATGFMDLRRCFFQEEGIKKEGKFHTFRIIDVESADPDEFWRLSAETKKEVEEWLQIMQATHEHFQTIQEEEPREQKLPLSTSERFSDEELEIKNKTIKQENSTEEKSIESKQLAQVEEIDLGSEINSSGLDPIDDSSESSQESSYPIVGIEEVPSTFQQSISLYKNLLDYTKWSLVLSNQDVQVYSLSGPKNVLVTKFIVPSSPDHVLSVLLDTDLRKNWDPFLSHIKKPESLSKPNQDYVYLSLFPWFLPSFPFVSATFIYRSFAVFVVFLSVSPLLLPNIPSFSLFGLSLLLCFFLSIMPFSPLISRPSSLYVQRAWGRDNDGVNRYIVSRCVRSTEYPSTCEVLGSVCCVRPTGAEGESLVFFSEDLEFSNRLPYHFRSYLRVVRSLQTSSSLRTFILLHLAQSLQSRSLSRAVAIPVSVSLGGQTRKRTGTTEKAKPLISTTVDTTVSVGTYELPDNKYTKFVKETIDEMLSAKNETESDGWILSLESEGMTIYRKDIPGTPITYIKGSGIFPVDAQAYLDILLDNNRKPEYDSMYKDGRVVEQVDERTTVVTQSFHAIWPTSARDFLLIQHWTKLPDGTLLSGGKSIEHPECPERKDHVRGQVYLGGFLMKPVSGSSSSNPQTEITYISKFDLRGNIPSRVVSLIARKQPLTTVTIAKLLTK